MIEYLVEIKYCRDDKEEIAKASMSCNEFLTDEKLERSVINICKAIKKIYSCSKIVILDTEIKIVE
jgi:hypothetical protein